MKDAYWIHTHSDIHITHFYHVRDQGWSCRNYLNLSSDLSQILSQSYCSDWWLKPKVKRLISISWELHPTPRKMGGWMLKASSLTRHTEMVILFILVPKFKHALFSKSNRSPLFAILNTHQMSFWHRWNLGRVWNRWKHIQIACQRWSYTCHSRRRCGNGRGQGRRPPHLATM